MEVTITLLDELVKRAQAAGLLTDERLTVILEAELTRAKHAESFKQMVEAIRGVEPPLTEAEIEEELNARRAERLASVSGDDKA